LDEADHFVSEICVTYLNSNDFKTDLIRNPLALPTQLTDYIIEEAVKGKGVTARIIGRTQRLKIRSQQPPTKNEPHGSNGSISMTIAVMSIEQGSIVISPIEKSAD
jgi:hypothetical protein